MAKFLETQAISNELMKLIKDAKEKIILISPYLKVNSQIQERLKTKSKVGTLSEIVIVYGKTELKNSELEWIKEIEDLKLFEKNNLHAKCYINEDKAIICSMNLYDYSQQNNIEMGLMITKEQDKEAYQELIEEINNIKINGVRKRFDGKDNDEKLKIKEEIKETPFHEEAAVVQLSNEQKLKFQILRNWRLFKSKLEKTTTSHILTDEEIRRLSCTTKIDKNKIFDILPKKNAIKYGEEIVYEITNASQFTIGKVINVWYQDDASKYDRVKLKIEASGEEKWFDTTKELPYKDKVVAARLNNNWFNEYFYLDN